MTTHIKKNTHTGSIVGCTNRMVATTAKKNKPKSPHSMSAENATLLRFVKLQNRSCNCTIMTSLLVMLCILVTDITASMNDKSLNLS